MHWLDILIVVVVVASAVFGMAKGLFLQAALIAGVVCALFVARENYGGANDFLANFFTRSVTLTAVSYASVFLLFCLLVASIALTVRDGLRFFPGLGRVDQIGGAILGVVMGAVLAESLLVLAGRANDPMLSASLRSSYLAAGMRDFLPGIKSLIPDQFLPTAS